MRRWTAVAALLVLAALVLAPWALGPPTRPTTDDKLRIVSLAPPITETLAAIGALDQVVARSEWCRHPPEVTTLPPVGSALTPDLERIATRTPSHILVDGSQAVPVDDLEVLAPVEALPWLTLEEVQASVARLGQLTGHNTAAAAIVEQLAPLATAPPEGAPEVLLALRGEGLEDGEVWYIKRNSLHGAALHAAGARHAIDEDVDGPPVLSLEALVALNPPAVIVLVPATVGPAEEQTIREDWGRLPDLAAVRSGRIAVVGGPTRLSTGPAILDTVTALQAAIESLGTP